MGCGRSTLGSDSPRRSSKATDDDEDVETEESDAHLPKSTHSGLVHGPGLVPFSSGGQLLAQSKLSKSQLDFFKMLEEKIESGPDYDSEEEEICRQHRLQSVLRQWEHLFPANNSPERRKLPSAASSTSKVHSTRAQQQQPPPPPPPSSSEEEDEEAEEEEKSEPESIPGEAVKEQYMFMGNLYTLTRFHSDGSHIPKVDVSPAPVSPRSEAESCLEISKVNGAYNTRSSEHKRLKENNAANAASSSSAKASNSGFFGRGVHSRPASLVLRTVFQNKETEATS